MHVNMTLATAKRVFQQLSHDLRTLALLFVVPCLLLGLLAWIYEGGIVFDRIGAPLLGLIPLIMMFVVTSVATLRERTTGTLERILVLPIGRLDILLGYALTFGVIAVVQGVIVSTVSVYAYDLDVAGPLWFLLLLSLSAGLVGATLGLCASALAKTEFQAVQFMPAFVLPQMLLCGLLIPVDELPRILEAIANVLPLTYIVDAMQLLTHEATPGGEAYSDLAAIGLFAIAALFVGAATLRRQTD